MGPRTKELIYVLEQIIALLDSDDENHWKRWMVETKRRLLNLDYSGIEYLLGAYGGMGSFNDLIICQCSKNEKYAWKKDYKEKNELLSKLRSEAWEIASYIKRNHEIEDTEQGN